MLRQIRKGEAARESRSNSGRSPATSCNAGGIPIWPPVTPHRNLLSFRLARDAETVIPRTGPR